MNDKSKNSRKLFGWPTNHKIKWQKRFKTHTKIDQREQEEMEKKWTSNDILLYINKKNFFISEKEIIKLMI